MVLVGLFSQLITFEKILNEQFHVFDRKLENVDCLNIYSTEILVDHAKFEECQGSTPLTGTY